MHRDVIVSEGCMTEEKTRAWGEDESLLWFHSLTLNNTSMGFKTHSSRIYALPVSPF
jgi:hypothetical protein